MSTTQPVRDLAKLRQLRNFYFEKEKNLRNYTMICMGVNSALRISDLLQLKWKDVYDFDSDTFRYRIIVIEKKTKKETRIAMNERIIQTLQMYKENLDKIEEETYIFPGRGDTKEKPLSRSQAYRIIRHAAEELHMEKGISCHSLRKTFGYHAWKDGVPSAILMEIYNHSSYEITRRYLGIEQKDKDEVFFSVKL